MDKPHWHEQNPWKDQLIYVSIEELAACHMQIEKPFSVWSMVDAIAHWAQYGDQLDAYILNSVVLTGGVRYGPEGHHYISPPLSLPKLRALLKKYQPVKETGCTPGSEAAINRGCTCPVMDNHHGQGRPGGQYIVREGCPVHTSSP